MKTCIMGVAVLALAAGSAIASTQGSNASNPTTGMRAVLPTDGSWTTLDETIGVGGFFSGPWTYTSASSIQLDVTDLYVVSDAFNVYVDGGFIGGTPILPDYAALGLDPFGASFAGDPDTAWASALFSKGSFVLPAGTHDVSFQATYIPLGFNDSTIAFRAHAVPAPAAAGLAGLAGLAAFRRRR